ncbi:MAG: trypsin-like peptidase domain-containing protein [Chloroflexi bacterium]|nr:trypsin-like peptidase domain-containing protein [Chloroflexota bacterium]
MPTSLEAFSDALADAVAQAAGSIVRVEARRRLPASGIAWTDTAIVTANHVVERSEGIRIGLPSGESVPAELVGRDPSTDIAVLRVQGGLTPIARSTKDIRVGHLVMAVGRPGKNEQASAGIVSAIGSSEPSGEDDRPRRGGFSFAYSRGGGGVMLDGAIHSDVVMYPGFSGGPLIDSSGHAVGLTTSAVAAGTSLTIPVSTLERVFGQLTEHGKIKRGFIGVSLQAMRLTESLADSIGQRTGLLIVATEAGGPADAAGLYQGDIVVALDGQRTRSLDELMVLLNSDRIGKSVAVRVIRGGQAQDIPVTIAERE